MGLTMTMFPERFKQGKPVLTVDGITQGPEPIPPTSHTHKTYKNKKPLSILTAEGSVSLLFGPDHAIYTWWFCCFKAAQWLGASNSPNKAIGRVPDLSFLSANLSTSFLVSMYTLCYAFPILADCTL